MGKLDARAVEGILIGYSRNTKGWITYSPSTKKITISRNVEFFETMDGPADAAEEEEDEELLWQPTKSPTVVSPPKKENPQGHISGKTLPDTLKRPENPVDDKPTPDPITMSWKPKTMPWT